MKSLNFISLFAAVLIGFVLSVYTNLHLSKFLDGTLGGYEAVIYCATIVVLGLFAPLYYLFFTGSEFAHDTVINGRAIAFLVSYVWYCAANMAGFALLNGTVGIELNGIMVFNCYVVQFVSGVVMLVFLMRYQARLKELGEPTA